MRTATASVSPATITNGVFRYRDRVTCGMCKEPALSHVSIDVVDTYGRERDFASVRVFHDSIATCATHKRVALEALDAVGVKVLALRGRA
jgi:hypothetical protein